jgi:hypothetical protein
MKAGASGVTVNVGGASVVIALRATDVAPVEPDEEIKL